MGDGAPPESRVDPGFWAGRRVFVTGHTGFKGSWLSLWLRHMGAEVAGYALAPPSDPNLFSLADVADGIIDHRADVRDLDTLSAAMRDHAPEVVFHLAAQALVRPSYDDPVETFSTNVMGTVNVLEAARSIGSLRAVVVITSDKCYENREHDRGYAETDAMGGHDPYSSSKGCAELVTASFRNSFFSTNRNAASIATARAGNIIGGGDWGTDRLIPDLMRAFAAGEEALIRYPDAIRPWQHVLDPTAGYLTLAQRLCESGPEFGEGWNFGPPPESERPVRHLVETMSTLWGDGAGWTLDSAETPHEAGYLKLNVTKSRARLGWRARLDLAGALEQTVAWYKGLADGGSARALTLQQIENYASDAPDAEG